MLRSSFRYRPPAIPTIVQTAICCPNLALCVFRGTLNLPTTGTWTQIIIPGINVTNGQCDIGFWSSANAGNWINVDNIEFYKSVSSTARIATSSEVSSITPVAEEVSASTFPNPFKDRLSVNYQLEADQHVQVVLYNTAGNPKVLVHEKQVMGVHSVEYNAENDVPGLYNLKIAHGNKSSIHKIYKMK